MNTNQAYLKTLFGSFKVPKAFIIKTALCMLQHKEKYEIQKHRRRGGVDLKWGEIIPHHTVNCFIRSKSLLKIKPKKQNTFKLSFLLTIPLFGLTDLTSAR